MMIALGRLRRYLSWLICLLLSTAALAEEIDGEVTLSDYGSYGLTAPGFSGSIRPEFLQVKATWPKETSNSVLPRSILFFGEFSLGAGLSLNFSSRKNYLNDPIQAMPDSIAKSYPGAGTTQWYFYRERYLEVVSFDVFLEGRWQLLEHAERTNLREWLTLTCGVMLNSVSKSIFLANYQDSTGYDSTNSFYQYVVDYKSSRITLPTEFRWDPYISPGILVGVGNFIFGYRLWFYFDQFNIVSGEPPRVASTIRLGYRFTW